MANQGTLGTDCVGPICMQLEWFWRGSLMNRISCFFISRLITGLAAAPLRSAPLRSAPLRSALLRSPAGRYNPCGRLTVAATAQCS